MASVKPIRILIADNDSVFIDVLKSYLNNRPEFAVVSTARDGLGAIDACREYWPDVAIINVQLPVLDGVKTIRTIRAGNENTKILAIYAPGSERYALPAIKAGAQGCIGKHKSGDYREVARTIRRIANDEVILDPMLASDILQEFS